MRKLDVESVLKDDALGKDTKIMLSSTDILPHSSLFFSQFIEEFLQSKYKDKLKTELIQPTFIRLLNLMKPVVIALSTLIFMLIVVCSTVLLYLVHVT